MIGHLTTPNFIFSDGAWERICNVHVYRSAFRYLDCTDRHATTKIPILVYTLLVLASSEISVGRVRLRYRSHCNIIL